MLKTTEGVLLRHSLEQSDRNNNRQTCI